MKNEVDGYPLGQCLFFRVSILGDYGDEWIWSQKPGSFFITATKKNATLFPMRDSVKLATMVHAKFSNGANMHPAPPHE